MAVFPSGFLRRYDWGLFVAMVLLVAVGLAAIASLSLNSQDHPLTTFIRQLIFAIVGLALFVVVSAVDYRFFRSLSWPLYGLGIAALVAVLFFGTTIRSTKGWFELYGQTIQPVEFVKLILILVLSKVLAERFDRFRPWRIVPITAAVALPFLLLVFLQPDLGSVLMLLAIWLSLLAFIRLPGRVILVFILGGIVLATVGWFAILQDYQRDRIQTFLNPNSTTETAQRVGYNLRQAQVAVGSGELFGRGLGLGPQSQLDFLPVQETDFLFAVIAEELGFVGAVLVISLYGFFFWRLIRLMRRVQDDYAAFVIAGVTSAIFLQAAFNIGMNIGLLPVVGLPLPLLSYGGSALLATIVMVGIVESIAIRASGERVSTDWSRGGVDRPSRNR